MHSDWKGSKQIWILGLRNQGHIINIYVIRKTIYSLVVSIVLQISNVIKFRLKSGRYQREHRNLTIGTGTQL